jgi:3-oxoacyl-[acyl-carrier-protein] synthase-3
MDKASISIHETGNTSSASIPLAMFGDFGQVKPKDGDIVLLVGFGAGMTAASAILRWNAQ